MKTREREGWAYTLLMWGVLTVYALAKLALIISKNTSIPVS